MSRCSKCRMPNDGSGTFMDQCFCPAEEKSLKIDNSAVTITGSLCHIAINHPLANQADRVLQASTYGVSVPFGWDLLPVGAIVEDGDEYWAFNAQPPEWRKNTNAGGTFTVSHCVLIRQRGKSIQIDPKYTP